MSSQYVTRYPSSLASISHLGSARASRLGAHVPERAAGPGLLGVRPANRDRHVHVDIVRNLTQPGNGCVGCESQPARAVDEALRAPRSRRTLAARAAQPGRERHRRARAWLLPGQQSLFADRRPELLDVHVPGELGYGLDGLERLTAASTARAPQRCPQRAATSDARGSRRAARAWPCGRSPCSRTTDASAAIARASGTARRTEGISAPPAAASRLDRGPRTSTSTTDRPER